MTDVVRDESSPDIARDLLLRLQEALESVLLGQRTLVRELLTAIVAGGHVLLEGLPGLGKTHLAKGLANALGVSLGRVQCTPDLMPSDITGSEVLQRTAGGQVQMEFLPGPIFASLVLVDEINRATPRTQAALLEAMQERRLDDASAVMTDEDNETNRYARAVKDLCSGDTDRIQHALESGLIDAHLTPHLVPLLANDEVAEDVRTELRWLVPQIIGQLTDAMLDPDMPLLARQRIPGVLEATHNPRTIDGLLLGMTDSCFNIRFSCARALARRGAAEIYAVTATRAP